MAISSNYDPSRLRFDEETHSYFLDGVKVPGVTSIIGSWIKVKAGQLDYMVNPYTKQVIDFDVMVQAAEKGTAIHKGAGLILTGEGIDWDALPDVLVKPLRSVEKWIKAMRPKPIAVELGGYHEVNGIFYAGTLDWVVEFAGHIWLIDIKTGDTDEWMVDVQCSAYEPFAKAHLGIKKLRRAVLYVPKDGRPCHIQCLERKDAFRFFSLKLQEHHWLKQQATAGRSRGDRREIAVDLLVRHRR